MNHQQSKNTQNTQSLLTVNINVNDDNFKEVFLNQKKFVVPISISQYNAFARNSEFVICPDGFAHMDSSLRFVVTAYANYKGNGTHLRVELRTPIRAVAYQNQPLQLSVDPAIRGCGTHMGMYALSMYTRFHTEATHGAVAGVSAKTDAALSGLKRIPTPGLVNPRDFSPEAWSIYSQEGGIAKPIYELQAGEQTFYTTDIIQYGGRKFIIGYVQFQGRYHIRLFYYSLSGGNWHCMPGIEMDDRFSKGELLLKTELSYEKGTLVVPELSALFDQMPEKNAPKNVYRMYGAGVTKVNHAPRIPHGNSVHQDPIGDNTRSDLLADAVEGIPLMGDNRVFASAFENRPTITIEGINQFMRSLPIPDDLMRNLRVTHSKPAHHTTLAIACTHYYMDTTWGQYPVTVIGASGSDDPSLFWIEDIYFTHATVSSWGFRRQQINAGILTAKPIEYDDQCPAAIDPNRRGVGRRIPQQPHYIDIRPFIQENPLIKKIKQAVGH